MPRLPSGPRAATHPVHSVKEHPAKEHSQAPGVLVYVEGKAKLLAFEQLVAQALKYVPHLNPPAIHPAPAAHLLLCPPPAGKLKPFFTWLDSNHVYIVPIPQCTFNNWRTIDENSTLLALLRLGTAVPTDLYTNYCLFPTVNFGACRLLPRW